MLRLFLPPNLAAAAARDAIPIKVELNLKAPPSAELLAALALLSQWTGGGAPPVAKEGAPHRAFLQLKRDQLRELLGSLRGQEVFVRVDRPEALLRWKDGRLEGVSEYL